tara:strand:- start:2562 stop:2972 length:411 start_codon:yes stop_codon:yes gene_type:complete
MSIEEKIKFLNKNTPIKNTFDKDTVVHCIHCKDNYYAYECSIENNQILCKDIINCDGSIIDWVVKNKKKIKPSNKKNNKKVKFIAIDDYTMTYKVRGNTPRPADARRYMWLKHNKKWNAIYKKNESKKTHTDTTHT